MRRHVITSLGLFLAVAGCNQILGVPDGFFNECGGPLDAPLECNLGGAGSTPSTSSTTATGGASATGGGGGTGAGDAQGGGGHATSTTSSGGSGGGSTTCDPDSQVNCYDGAGGTENNGICQGGKKTCAHDGSGYGPCTGEVTPQPELCSSTEDENCDGLDCVLWSQAPDSAAGSMLIFGIQYDKSANELVVAGFGQGSVTLGGITATAPSASAPLLARIRSDGSAEWIRFYGKATDGGVFSSVDVDASGNIYVAGSTTTALDLGTLSLDSGPFVGGLSSAGDPIWAKNMGPTDTDLGSVTVTGDKLVVSGTFRTSVDFGDGAVSGSGLYVAKLNAADGAGTSAYPGPSGIWARIAMGTEPGRIASRVDPSGNVVVAGGLAGTLTFNSTTYMATGQSDLLLMRLSPAGDVNSFDHYGAINSNNSILRLEVDPADGSAIVGAFISTTTVLGSGSNTITADPALGSTIISKWSSNGAPKWVRQYTKYDDTMGFTVDSSHTVSVLAAYSGQFDVVSRVLQTSANGAYALAKLNSDGEAIWARSYDFQGSATRSDFFSMIVEEPTGELWGAGLIPTNTFDFGAGSLSATFIARFGR